ncbi:MAG TPA: 4Fe-4S binding protein [Rhodocyclaceae bacterium]|nr:4Fe-4S binding protein [Rhodocyclaceae bacterium]
MGFFVLFVVAPLFDLLRFDLVAGHAYFLGMPWHIGIDEFVAGRIGAGELAFNLMLRVFVPILAVAAGLLYAAWRWGRLYCGWLCPHFSVVETINRLMRRASGKQSVWDRKPGPTRNPDGSHTKPDAVWWLAVVPMAVGFAFVWAVVLLTYLLPPFEIYHNLFNLSLTRNQALFIGVGTLVLSVEFLAARHLFCRYACAVGLFQSLAWMGNRGGMVVGFARRRASDCASCYSACDHVCPMRLKPRNIKQFMFTCTQCGQCIDACATVQRGNLEGSLLRWVEGEAAKQNEAQVSLTGWGSRSQVSGDRKQKAAGHTPPRSRISTPDS